jgi:uncharacterized protein YijF (DUF1287 family)
MQNITKRKLKKLIPILILLTISILVIINLKTTNNSKQENIPANTEININKEHNAKNSQNIPQQKKLATLEINGAKIESELTESGTIYDFMQKARTDKKIDFKEKIYTSMGAFVEEINNIKNNGEQNWIYYVNNQKANIGISNYKLMPGDIVSWRFEKAF